MKRYQVSRHFQMTAIFLLISIILLGIYVVNIVRVQTAPLMTLENYKSFKDGKIVRLSTDQFLIGKAKSTHSSVSAELFHTYYYFTISLGGDRYVAFGVSQSGTISKFAGFEEGKGSRVQLLAKVDKITPDQVNVTWHENVENFDLDKQLIQTIRLQEVAKDDYQVFLVIGMIFFFLSILCFFTIGGIKKVYVHPFEDSKKYRDAVMGRGFDLDKQLEKERRNLEQYRKEQAESYKSYGTGLALIIGGLLVIVLSVALTMGTMVILFLFGVIPGGYLILMSPYWFWHGFVNSDSALAKKLSDLFLLRTTSVRIEESTKLIAVLEKHVEEQSKKEEVRMWYGPGVWEQKEGDAADEGNVIK